MKAFFSYLWKTLAAILGGLFLAVAVLWVWPTIAINRSNLVKVLNYFTPGQISGEVTQLEIHYEGLVKKRVVLEAKGLCFELPGMLKTCAEKTYLDVYVTARAGMPTFAIDDLVLVGTTVDGKFTASREPEKKEVGPSLLLPQLPDVFSMLSLKHARIELTRLNLDFGDGILKTKALLDVGGSNSTLRWHLTSEGGYSTSPKNHYEWNGAVSATTGHSPLSGPFSLTTKITGRFPTQGELSLKIKGTSSIDTLNVTLDGEGKNLIPHFPKVGMRACNLGYQVNRKFREDISVNCPIKVTGAFCQFDAKVCDEVFKETETTLISKVRLESDKDGDRTISGQLAFAVDSIFHRMKEGKAGVSLVVAGKVKDFPRELDLNSDIDLEVRSFQNIVRLLKNRPWSVPAPFNSLDGMLVLNAKAQGRPFKEGSKIPISLKTELVGNQQAIKIDSSGELTLKPDAEGAMTANLDLGVRLNEIRLSLPPLAASKPPVPFPDSRINPNVGKPTRTLAKKEGSFTYRVKIQTESPILLSSNLATRNIPISLDLNLGSDSGSTGAVRIASFPVELFRRKATIEHLDLFLKKDPRYNEINGRIRVVSADYTAYVVLLGLADRPEIRFESVPPLPEDEVIAILVFGKRPEKLTADEANSVGNTRAAMQDNALSLASMYLLASTPVESIGYDPVMKSFTARIRLADGTSMLVGSDFKDINQLGIRQRLGSNWSISTFVNDPFAVVNRSLTALLEWSVGY